MSAEPVQINPHVQATELSTDSWIDRLTHAEALNDSPTFRQSLFKAELIAAHIQGHYIVAVENCRQAIKTGEAFAAALSNLAKCMDMDFLPRPCVLPEMPSRWSGVRCEPFKALKQVNQLLTQLATHTADLAVRLGESEQILSKARVQLGQLFDLRTGFHRASDQLESALTRSAGANPSRSQTDMTSIDSQVTELRQIYRNTASAYMAGLRAAIESTHSITYLRSNCALLLAGQDFVNRLKTIFCDSGTASSAYETSDSLISFMTQLVNWSETSHRMTRSCEDYASRQSVANEKANYGSSNNVRLESYLFKRSSKRTWRTWARRWFRLTNNRLLYCKRVPAVTSSELQSVVDEAALYLRQRLNCSKTTSLANGVAVSNSHSSLASEGVNLHSRLILLSLPGWKVMEHDLRLCTARDCSAHPERRFTFELVASENRMHLLQAESFDNKERWIEALRSGLLHFQRSNHAIQDDDYYNGKKVRSNPQVFGNLDRACSRIALSSTDRSSITLPTSQQSIPDYDRLRSQGGVILWREPYGTANQFCADCGGDGADWASINLGVTLCTQCAAIHRGLGVHVSKIRSLTLDNWEPELLHLMLNLGNRLVNTIYEANLQSVTSRFPRPSANNRNDDRHRWIKAKWAQYQFIRFPLIDSTDSCLKETLTWISDIYRCWLKVKRQVRIYSAQSDGNFAEDSHQLGRNRIGSERDRRRSEILDGISKTFARLQQLSSAFNERPFRRSTLNRSHEHAAAAAHLLLAGARLGCPPLMLAGLASGAHPDGQNQSARQVAEGTFLPPLIAAVRSGSLAACEFLLLNGANIDVQDTAGRTPLHHACLLQRVHLTCLLLRRRANQTYLDRKGRLPLNIAVELGNADIVTLLRLQRLNDEDKNPEYNGGDDTVTDVFRDYTSRAYFFDSDSETSDLTSITIQHACSSPSISGDDSWRSNDKTIIPSSERSSERRTSKCYSTQSTSPCIADTRRRLHSPQQLRSGSGRSSAQIIPQQPSAPADVID